MNSIQVKNIYWMIVYALNVIEDKGIKSISGETFENVYDLCASLMSIALAKQVKRGLNKSYINKRDDSPCVRGKILIKETLLSNNYNNKIFCEYDEYNEQIRLNDGRIMWQCTCTVRSWGIQKTAYGISKKVAKKYSAYLVLCEHYNIKNEFENV